MLHSHVCMYVQYVQHVHTDDGHYTYTHNTRTALCTYVCVCADDGNYIHTHTDHVNNDGTGLRWWWQWTVMALVLGVYIHREYLYFCDMKSVFCSSIRIYCWVK